MKKNGFTIIEVLASMSVLVLILLGLMRVFPQASKAFQTGVEIADRNAAAQSVMNLLINDVENLVADNRLGLFKDAECTFTNYDSLYFVTTSDSDTLSGRDYIHVQYLVTDDTITNQFGETYTTYILKRKTEEFDRARHDPMETGTNSFCYDGMEGADVGEGTELLRNVVRFDFWVNGREGNGAIGSLNNTKDVIPPYDEKDFDWFTGINRKQTPHFIDVYIQIATDEAMKKYDLLMKSGQTIIANDTINRDSFVLVTRIYPTQLSQEYLYPSEM